MTRPTASRRIFMQTTLGVAATLALGAAPLVHAQTDAFPTRAVSIVVPYGPGGVVDVTARLVAEGLSEVWGQPVVVENRPGAAGAIGAASVAKARGDGYTLFYADDGVLVSMPHFNSALPYDTLKDFKPVSTAGNYPYIVMANAKAGFRTLDALIAGAKASPGGLSYATNGVGSTHHLAWERFQQQAGIQLNHVPYKSAAPGMQDVMGGHIPVMTISIGTIVPVLQDERVVMVANLGTQRTHLLPDVPTARELGYDRFGAQGWLGLLAPGSTPDALVAQISRDVAKVVATEKFQDNMKRRGVDPEWMTPAGISERLRSEYEQNRDDIIRMNIK